MDKNSQYRGEPARRNKEAGLIPSLEDKKPGELVPMPHGGALQAGHRPGSWSLGIPKERLRQKLRDIGWENAVDELISKVKEGNLTAVGLVLRYGLGTEDQLEAKSAAVQEKEIELNEEAILLAAERIRDRRNDDLSQDRSEVQ